MIRLFSRYIPTRDILLFILEGLIISLGVLIAIGIRFSFDRELIISFSILKVLFVTIICQITLLYNEFYSADFKNGSRILLIKLLQSLGATSILLAILYFFFPLLIIGRGIFVLTMIILLPLLYFWRILCEEVPIINKKREKILIIGSSDLAIEIGKKVVENSSGFKVVGYIDEDKSKVGKKLFNPSIIGTPDEISSIVEKEGVQRIIVALTEMRGRLPIGPLLKSRLSGIEVEDGVSFYEKITGKIHISHLKPGWLIFSEGFREKKIAIAKRLMDVFFSLLSLIFFGPIMLIIALAIRIESPGAVFYRQERVGEGGKVFTLLKFRSMRVDAESESGPVWADEHDDRITRIGRFIRKWRMDEVPQMINVLRGEMSFVGPRPERPHFVEMLRSKIPYYSLRHTIKPGITGWAQTKYPYGASEEDAIEKLKYDMYYLKNMTLLFDLTIILDTVKIVLWGKGSR